MRLLPTEESQEVFEKSSERKKIDALIDSLPEPPVRPLPKDFDSDSYIPVPQSPLPTASTAAALLQQSPLPDLRRLHVEETEREIVLSGVVSSYYLKQLAHEAVRCALGGRRLRNRIVIVKKK